jgi:hypothetical protein
MPETNRVWLQRQGVKCLEPPVDGPNLNPAENVFSVTNRAVSLRRREIGSIGDLKRVMKEEFTKLPQSFLRACLGNFAERLRMAAADPASAGSNRASGRKKARQQL